MSTDPTSRDPSRVASGTKADVNPGDDAPPGTPGTGENVCPDCRGTGQVENQPCQTCGGTGKVVEGISGG